MGNTIGFIGLGNMGFPMAMRMIEAGHEVMGCDIMPGIRERFTANGGKWADSPHAVASQCEVVLASLPTPAAVERVALGSDGVIGGAKVRIFIDLSTSGPDAAKSVAKKLAERKIIAFDAPVSGGVHGAGKGALTVMASGPKATYDEIEPLLRCFGKSVFYVGGEPGMGQVMKLINNLLSATALAATCE